MFVPTFSALLRRGIVADATPSLATSINALLSRPRPPFSPPLSVYAGFDPTAPSLHLGHAAVLVLLLRLQRAGLRPIGLIGGATALIGDPTGRSTDRPLLGEAAASENGARLRACLQRVLGGDCAVVDNADFYQGMGAVAFLRDVGRHFRLQTLLARDSVRGRMGWAGGPGGGAAGAGGGASEGSAEGMSFTEFSYPLLQAHDFSVLHATMGAALQVGGSDQWGNITAGVEHIRRLRSGGAGGAGDGDGGELNGGVLPAHGATVPLLVDATGRKFGKSAANVPVWLSEELTSHLALWQHLAGVGDAEAPRLLAQLTLLEEGEVAAVVEEGARAPERKAAQVRLADEVVALLRGRAAADAARRTSSLLFSGSAMWGGGAVGHTAVEDGGGGGGGGHYLPQRAALPTLRASDLRDLAAAGQLPVARVAGAAVDGGAVDPLAALLAAGVCKSKSEAKRLLEAGGVYWNWERVSPREGGWAVAGSVRVRAAARGDFLEGAAAVVSTGKKRMALVLLEG